MKSLCQAGQVVEFQEFWKAGIRTLNSTDLASTRRFVCVIGLNIPDDIGEQRVEIFELVPNHYAIL